MYIFVYIRTHLFRDRTVTKNYSISRGNTADKAIPLRCHKSQHVYRECSVHATTSAEVFLYKVSQPAEDISFTYTTAYILLYTNGTFHFATVLASNWLIA